MGLKDVCIVCEIRNKIVAEITGKFKSKQYPAPDKAVYAFKKVNEIVYIGESKKPPRELCSDIYKKNDSTCFCSQTLNILERKKGL